MTNEMIFTNTFIKTPHEAQLMQRAATDGTLYAQVEVFPNRSRTDIEEAANAHYHSGIKDLENSVVPPSIGIYGEYLCRRTPEEYRQEAHEALERGAVLVRLTVTPDHQGEVTAQPFWVRFGQLKEGGGCNASLF